MAESNVSWIPVEEFKNRCLPWEQFTDLSEQENVRVIDARDNVQKGFLTPGAEQDVSPEQKTEILDFRQNNQEMLDALSSRRNVIAQPFDQLINNIIQKKRLQDQTLLIFDQVGKQVRWLMYHLEANGYTQYYFLRDGAYGVTGVQAYTPR